MSERQLSAGFTWTSTQIDWQVVLQVLESTTEACFSNLRLTHYACGPFLGARRRAWDRERVRREILGTSVQTLELWSVAGRREELSISVSRAPARSPDVVVLSARYADVGRRERIDELLRHCDDLARAFRIASGHLHDLAHFSEDNQLGPEYFRASRQPLDASRLRYSAVLQQQIVDIEQNPCHLHAIGGLDFTSAWTNYIGGDLLGLVGRDRVNGLEFPVVWLDSTLARITLFEEPFESRKAENVARLWRFRKALAIDEIAHSRAPAAF